MAHKYLFTFMHLNIIVGCTVLHTTEMIIAKLPSHCDCNSIYFTEPLHNISNNSTFSRIMICDSNSVINGLYIRLPLDDVSIHEISDWGGVCKHIAQYRTDVTVNADAVFNVQAFESSVLQLYKTTFNICANKARCCHIADTLLSGKLNLGAELHTADIGCDTDLALQLAAAPDQEQQHRVRVSPAANVLLKISGVWETDKMFGITFKYITT